MGCRTYDVNLVTPHPRRPVCLSARFRSAAALLATGLGERGNVTRNPAKDLQIGEVMLLRIHSLP